MRLRWVVAACVAHSLLATTAHAQMSEGERKAAARAAYAEGLELQDGGKPAAALSRFEAAQKLFDAPTHLLHIAECQTVTGKLVEASETYETLIRRSLAPGSPDAFVQAQEQGQKELAALRPRIPTMRVTVKPEPQTLQNLQITVNDRQMPVELVGIARPVNPGSYRVSATANGWSTPAPVTVDIPEKDAKSVDLTLQQGNAPPVVVPPPATTTAPPPPPATTTTAPPPPYDAKARPPEGPSTTGLLIGARAGIWVPGGDVDKTTSFKNYASAGPGLGLDLVARVAKIFLAGGSLELASLGAPDSNAYQTGKKAEVRTSSVYLGVLAGIMPNVEKVTFVADAGVGYRVLSQSLTLTDSATNIVSLPKTETTYTGFELAIAAGVSIPVGPLRLVPKAGVALGNFSNRSCSQDNPPANTPAGTLLTGCTPAQAVNEASHTMFNVVLGVYYHADLAKKSGTALGPRLPSASL